MIFQGRIHNKKAPLRGPASCRARELWGESTKTVRPLARSMWNLQALREAGTGHCDRLSGGVVAAWAPVHSNAHGATGEERAAVKIRRSRNYSCSVCVRAPEERGLHWNGHTQLGQHTHHACARDNGGLEAGTLPSFMVRVAGSAGNDRSASPWQGRAACRAAAASIPGFAYR